jgi:quercetin dioxygenase-like cupin family protein
MRRIFLAAALVAAVSVGGLSLASHGDHGRETVKKLSERDVIETVNGKEARVTTVEVTFGPRVSGLPHRHPGPIFGYVLEGQFELGLGDEPMKTLNAGDTFYEPGGILHRVSGNPSAKNQTRVLAVILHPRDAEQIQIPAGTE